MASLKHLHSSIIFLSYYVRLHSRTVDYTQEPFLLFYYYYLGFLIRNVVEIHVIDFIKTNCSAYDSEAPSNKYLQFLRDSIRF